MIKNYHLSDKKLSLFTIFALLKSDNPFSEVYGEYVSKGAVSRTMVDVETGQAMVLVEAGRGMYRRDKETFVKVFRNPVLFQINGVCAKIFWYVVFNLKPNLGWIEINVADVMAMGVGSDRYVYSGIRKLIALGVLARRDKGSYWVNPQVLYNGNRTK